MLLLSTCCQRNRGTLKEEAVEKSALVESPVAADRIGFARRVGYCCNFSQNH